MAEFFRNRCLSMLLTTSIYLLSIQGGVWVTHAASNGAAFLDKKEAEVQKVSSAASVNYYNCDLVSSCTLDCSRAVCKPRMEDVTICTKVENNAYCSAPSDGNNCKEMGLNYDKSYLTVPGGADAAILQPEVRRDSCSQRGLDPTFKSVSFPDNFSYVYFGSTSGAWTAYPGRDSSEEGCKAFECRKRPWYLDGISVLKQVKILIDTGNTMGTSVTSEFKRSPGASYLNVAIDIALSIIQTLAPGDYVDVISFNSTGAYSLSPPVNVGNYTQSNGVVLHPELDSLQNSVKKLTKSADPPRSNLTAAIIKAVSTFQNTALYYLKLVIVISDGYFIPLNSSTFPTTDISALKAKLLVYRLPPNYDESNDRFLINTTLQTVLCGVQGSFEVLDAPATANPLFAINSYFSYLAQVHMIVVGSKATWSNMYESIAQVRNAVTVTSPAFDKDGRLIGVAGIDVFINELDSNLQADVTADFDTSGRTRGSLPAPSSIPLVCSYQNQTVIPVCSNTPIPTDGTICKQSDSRSLQERVCCNTCAIPSPPPPFAWWRIFLAVAVPIVVIALSLTVFFLWKKHKELYGIREWGQSKPASTFINIDFFRRKKRGTQVQG
ncbi:hypothetical protein M758_12G180700 [Ceratodon purpureus]|nr:hypothetical protein M758_12G180700 [Ceratodon purpureus]